MPNTQYENQNEFISKLKFFQVPKLSFLFKIQAILVAKNVILKKNYSVTALDPFLFDIRKIIIKNFIKFLPKPSKERFEMVDRSHITSCTHTKTFEWIN